MALRGLCDIASVGRPERSEVSASPVSKIGSAGRKQITDVVGNSKGRWGSYQGVRRKITGALRSRQDVGGEGGWAHPGKLSGGGSFSGAPDTRESMQEKETGRGLVGQLHTIRLPVCPRMRPTETRWYAVDGYCVLDGSPGCLMIPSIELFQRYCTTPRFPECPWFARRAEKKGEASAPHGFSHYGRGVDVQCGQPLEQGNRARGI